MSDFDDKTLQTDDELRSIEKIIHTTFHPTCVVGFDGFTDEIVTCVHTRQNAHHFEPISTISAFAHRIAQAAGKSTNIELVSKETRIGGNAPLLAQGLLETNNHVTLIGALGYPNPEPIFTSLISRCAQTISIAPSGHTDALEFQDGKILFGKLQNVLDIDTELLRSKVSTEELLKLFSDADIIASVNWTMISGMTGIWKYFDQHILPHLPPKKRWMFIDLADPAKRTREDLIEALQTLSALQSHINIILGLNEAEAHAVAKALELPHSTYTKEETSVAIKQYAQSICQKLDIEIVVIHATDCAAGASRESSAIVIGPYCKKPHTTTGGGDNFNAGFLLGIAYNQPLKISLTFGCATSGFYVRTGKSPSLTELYAFTKLWKENPESLDKM